MNQIETCQVCKESKKVCCGMDGKYIYCAEHCPWRLEHRYQAHRKSIMENKPMRKFYTTMSPDSARHILRDTAEEAISKATNEVLDDGRTRYVVEIIYKVEKDNPPVKVTKL